MAKKENTPLVFTLSKDSLDSLIAAFKPAVKEKTIKFSLVESETENSLTLQAIMDDVGNVTVFDTYLEFLDMTDVPNDFYISIDVLKNIAATLQAGDMVSFSVGDTTLTLNIGNTEIKLSLVPQDIDISTEFDPKESEELLSDKVNLLVTRLKVVKSSGSSTSPVIAMGKEIRMGSQTAYTIIQEGYALNQIEFKTVPEFFDYFANSTKFADAITLELNDDKSKVRITAGPVTYIIRCLGDNVELPFIDEILNDRNTRCVIAKSHLLNELAKLSIPVAGMKDALRIVKLEAQKENLHLSVKDFGNQISFSDIPVAFTEGESVAKVNLDRLRDCCSQLSDDIDLDWFEAAVTVGDDAQVTLLAAEE